MRPLGAEAPAGTATTTSARIIGSAYWGVTGTTLVSDISATAPTAMSSATRTRLDRGDRAAAGQRGRRDRARQPPRPRDEAGIVDLNRTRPEVARHRVGNPEQSDRAVDRGERGSDVSPVLIAADLRPGVAGGLTDTLPVQRVAARRCQGGGPIGEHDERDRRRGNRRLLGLQRVARAQPRAGRRPSPGTAPS